LAKGFSVAGGGVDGAGASDSRPDVTLNGDKSDGVEGVDGADGVEGSGPLEGGSDDVMLKGEADDGGADPGLVPGAVPLVFPKGEESDTDGAGELPKRDMANPKGELADEEGAAAVPGEAAVVGTVDGAPSVAGVEDDSCVGGRSLPTSFI